MPRVTVVIATYNRSRVLKCALRSVANQAFQDFEVWVVGDGCTDDTEAVVAAMGDPRFHWTNLPSRVGGQFGPNNEGVRRAVGEFVAYLGHDDLWFPWHLSTLIHTADRERADFTYGGVVFLAPDGPREAYGNAKVRAQVSVSPPSGWLHRRSIVDTCGPWRDPATEPIGQDVGFQARAFQAGFIFAPSARFSVLKFPSHWWKLYSPDADLPQERLLDELERDPLALQADVLTKLSLAYSKQVQEPTVSGGLRASLRAAQRDLGEWYGVERWPLSAYLRARSARRRRSALARRGL